MGLRVWDLGVKGAGFQVSVSGLFLLCEDGLPPAPSANGHEPLCHAAAPPPGPRRSAAGLNNDNSPRDSNIP